MTSDVGTIDAGVVVDYPTGVDDGLRLDTWVKTQVDEQGLQLPSVPDTVTGGAGANASPSLEPPKMSIDDMILMVAQLQSKVADERTKLSVTDIKGKAAVRKQKDEERIKKIEASAKKIAKAKKSGKIGKIFGWVGAVASLVIGVAMIATGVGALAGGLMIAAAVVGLASMTLQSIPKVAKWMSSTKGGKALFWTLVAVQAVLAIGSLGAGVVANSSRLASMVPGIAAKVMEASSAAAEVGSKAYFTWKVVGIIAGIVTASSAVGGGIAGIEQAKDDKDGKQDLSDAKKLAAMLAKLSGYIQDETKRLKELLEEAEEGMTVCMQIMNGQAKNKEQILSYMKPTV